jgi:uncharacterized protein
MKCPVCPESLLVMADRQGVEIDYCPTCRGVWLDRGELDKLMEKSASREAASATPASAGIDPRAVRRDFDDSDQRRHGYPHRRKSWLSEIFD